MVILEENFKWHLEAFASELFIYIILFIYIYLLSYFTSYIWEIIFGEDGSCMKCIHLHDNRS